MVRRSQRAPNSFVVFSTFQLKVLHKCGLHFDNQGLSPKISLNGRLLDVNLVDFVPCVDLWIGRECQNALIFDNFLPSNFFFNDYRLDLFDQCWLGRALAFWEVSTSKINNSVSALEPWYSKLSRTFHNFDPSRFSKSFFSKRNWIQLLQGLILTFFYICWSMRLRIFSSM